MSGVLEFDVGLWALEKKNQYINTPFMVHLKL